MNEFNGLSAVPTATWAGTNFDLESTLRGDYRDEDTVVDLAPAGALAPRETLPPIDPAFLADVATETAVVLAGRVRDA